MSDEEAVEDRSMKQKQPELRSQVYNKFMDRLDERATNSKFARKKRVIVTPVKSDFLANIKPWMICKSVCGQTSAQYYTYYHLCIHIITYLYEFSFMYLLSLIYRIFCFHLFLSPIIFSCEIIIYKNNSK